MTVAASPPTAQTTTTTTPSAANATAPALPPRAVAADGHGTATEVPADATCVEFLHLMKAFSESAVNVTEMAQRVDSLVHQDEQLLRLLPLQPSPADDAAQAAQDDAHAGGRASTSSSRGSSSGSVADTTDDETSSASGRAANDHGVDVEAMAAAMDLSMAEGMKKWHEEALKNAADEDDDDDAARTLDDDDMDLDLDLDVDLDVDEDDSDEGFVSDEMDVDEDESMDDDGDDDDDDGASTDVDTLSSSQPRIGSLGEEDEDEDEAALHERRAQEDLQRWMELELDLDSTEDPYDASLHLPGLGPTLHSAPLAPAVAVPSTSAATTSVANAALGVHSTLATTAGSHANSSSVLSTTTAMATNNRIRAAFFDRKSVTAALFDDEDDEDDEDDATDLVLMNALMRKKNAAQKPTLVGSKRPLDQETKTDDDAHGGTIWGMEVDSYEQDLLSSIDHSVLCDRENRFLQWDLEIEAATAAAVAAAAVSQKTELRTPPSSISTSGSSFAAASAEARQKLMMASSPRDHKISQPLRSPSNVDTNFAAEDWSSLDFGTFQNRTVSHILSSCLHKRKLHHPYKDRVTLVNFNVPGGEPIGPPLSHTAMPAPTGSLLFGAGLEAADVLLKSGNAGAVVGLLSSNAIDSKESKMVKSSEKKAKKPRVDGDRKKHASQKLDQFDFDASSEDHAGQAGYAAKMAMTKLENLPLPDLTNLPQDLKELKRKIEATEHKVEGTKHRHRKGGPCPRCQVQNQLRAAKRAYHKRAVAHKKLPQLGTVSPALTATAVVVTPPPSTVVATPVVAPTVSLLPTISSKTLVPTSTPGTVAAAAEAVKSATLKATSAASAATVAGAPATIVRPASVPTAQPTSVGVPATPLPAAKPAAVVVAGAAATISTATLVAKAPAPSPSASNSVLSPNMAAATAVASSTPSPFPRRSCGENALTSPFSSPSTVPSSGSTPSSPESASPPVHHVTVTSA